MSKSISIVAIVFLFSLAVTPAAFAVSGECSYHNGVDCAAGPNAQGYAVCNDGWVSSVSYSNADECDPAPACPQPVVVGCINQNQLTILQNELSTEQSSCENIESNERASAAAAGELNFTATGEGCDDSDLQQQIASCQTEINDYQTELQNYQQCVEQSVEQSTGSLTLGCMSQHGNLSIFNPQNNRCECAAGDAPDSSHPFACIPLSGFCLESAGSGAIPVTSDYVDGVALSVNCTCASGYAWNSNQTQCVAEQAAAPVSVAPALNLNNLPFDYTITQTSTPTATSSAQMQGITINRNLNIDASGDAVVSLQTFLENGGYLTLPTGTMNGYFGNLTKQALIAYQKSVGLPATGYCGPMTREIINGK